MGSLWIVTVVRNDRSGLRATMESISRQSQRPNLLIIDGDSDDGTTEDARRWASRLHGEYLSEPDQGPYDAMNKALQLLPYDARVWFINAGDLLLPDDAVATAERHTGHEGFTWGFGPHLVIEKDGAERRIVRGVAYSLANHAYGRTPICHQAVIARVGRLRDFGGFDLTFPIAADYKLLLQIGTELRPSVWPEVLVAYRAGGISDRALRLTIREQRLVRHQIQLLRHENQVWDALHQVREASYNANRHLRHAVGSTFDVLANLGLFPDDWRGRRGQP